MLDYDFTFKEGILFIILKGEINKNTSILLSTEISPLIIENGITKVVFNLEALDNIDNYGVKAIYNCYLKLNESGHMSICEIPFQLKSKFKKLYKYIKEREDEFTLLTKS